MPDHPDPRARSVRGILELQALKSPAADFLIAPETGRRLGFGDLLRSSRALAAFLAAQGITAGAHVGLLLPNGLQAVRLFVGLAAGGHVVVPLSLIAQPAQLAFILGHSDCRAVFVDPAREQALRTVLSSVDRDVRVFVVDPDQGLLPGEPVQADASWPAPEPVAEVPALLMYTSGTTGQPKGVLLSHRNILAGARFVSEAHRLNTSDRVLAVLPLYHINAQIVTVLAPLHHGGSLVMPRRFSATDFWRLAAEHDCTWLNVVPTMIAYLLQHETAKTATRGAGRLRFCRSASAPLPPAQQRAFEERFGVGIIETMGLTETAAPVFANPVEPGARRLGSPGRAFGNEARVIDPDSGVEQAVGAVGEIVVRGENVMAAYYKAPEESARLHRRRLASHRRPRLPR
jgi:acyl-CoA synthetase (AMP-forming)/AMP-acid ligase II